ncbi:hypothetical protein KKF91_00670, partial [Myxococcota bacterium]|nr:hypothetical protein [Myxococcota bacterium]
GLRCDAVAAPPTDELCNELDDDCDTLIDEDFPDKGQPCEVGVGECLRVGERVCDLDGGLSCGVDPGPAIDELCDGLDNDCDGRLDNGAPCQGPPMGRVTSMRVEEFIAPEGCRDFDEDGQPDNALGAVAGLLNGPLNASLLDGQRVLYLQALDAHLAVMEGDAEGPIWRAFNAAGLPRGLMPTQWEAGQITSTLPLAALPLMAPTFYDRAAAEALSLLPLYEAIVLGGLAEVEGGLRAEALRFTGYFNRAELLNAYAAAERACFGQRRFECPDGSVIEAARWCDEIIDCPGFTDEDSLGCVASLFTCGDVELPRAALCDGVADCADGEDEALPFCPPAQALPGCAIFDDAPLDILSANLEADLDLNGDGDFEAVSACLLLSLEPQASLPQGGQTCVDDSDCYAGLRCRPMPVDEGDGLRLIRRCERPVGRGALGEACAVDEDCAHGLCLRYTASGGVCSALCGADAECFEGARCRGLPSPLTAADTVGGRTMRACLPTSGSQAPCDHTCPGSEVCAIYFDEGAGDPTAWVGAVGHCEAPHPEGAALGAVCEVAWGCAHGGGCASVGEALACLQPCALPGSCAQGQVCMDQPLMGEVAVMHPACVPLLDGSSGLPCQGGLDCPGGERCAPFYLSGAQAVERACVRGEGFYSVGTRCQADGECASGVCLQYCADLCSINEDCGASLGCHEDAYLDDEGRALGGLCGPAALACQSDNDCRQDPTCCDEDDPSCLSLRCVCDARRCRIGCRVGGSCPTGLVCLDDGRCALYCRDDADEAGGNDLLEDATLLPLGREAPIHTRVGHLCAASPVDWYGFNHPGVAPYRLEISQVEGEAILMEVEIFDAFGRLLRRLEPVDGGFVYEQTREEALASQGQLIYFRVRATGFERGASYNLSVDLSALVEDCLDPDPEEPRDAHWQPYEIGAQPALNPIEVVEGRLCPLDEDWYKLWVGNGDTLSVTLERLDEADPQPGSVEVFLIGPDHPDLESAQTLSQLNDSGEMIYSPPSMTCDSAATRNCKFDDGLVTRMFCYNDLNCTGAPYSLRVRSDRPLSEIPYRLTFDIQRAEAPLCVADLYEQNHAYMDMRRYHGAMAPELRVLEQGTIINGSGVGEWATLPYNTPVRMEMRACGAENAYADSIADRDSISLWMNEDEAFEVVIDQRGGQSQDLKLNIIQWTGTNVTVQRTYNFSDAHYVQRYTAPLESVYGVVIDRQKNTAQPNPSYVYDLAYDLTLTRVPASSVVEQDCDALGTSVNFVFGNSSTVAGSTLGHRDDHQPLDCEGGDGPDRVYAVDLPANQFGRLDATVVAQDGSDPAISIRTDCAVAFSEQACNEDDLSAAHPDRQAHASALFQGGQRVYVIVDSYDADSAGAFLLTLQWTRQ